jgi:hypothetical protein
MKGGKNCFFPKEMNANRFFWDSYWLEIWSNQFCPFMGPNGGSVAMDSGVLSSVTRETGGRREGMGDKKHSWASASAFRLPVSQSRTGAFRYRTGSSYSGTGLVPASAFLFIPVPD